MALSVDLNNPTVNICSDHGGGFWVQSISSSLLLLLQVEFDGSPELA
jgi:hypothetical protein